MDHPPCAACSWALATRVHASTPLGPRSPRLASVRATAPRLRPRPPPGDVLCVSSISPTRMHVSVWPHSTLGALPDRDPPFERVLRGALLATGYRTRMLPRLRQRLHLEVSLEVPPVALRTSTHPGTFRMCPLELRLSLIGRVVDLVLVDDTLHRLEVEGEHLDGLLVAVAHARIEKAGVVRVRAPLVHALVVVGGAHRLAPRDLRVARKVPIHE